MELVERTNATQKLQRLDVAAGQNVMPVVDALSRSGITKRRRAPAKAWARLEKMNRPSTLDQCRGRGQPSKATADDDDIRHATGKTRQLSGAPAAATCVSRWLRVHLRQRQPQSRERPCPRVESDQRSCGSRHANQLREDVVVAPFDSPENLLINGAHDLGRDQPPSLCARQRPRGPLEVLPGTAGLKREQRTHWRRDHARAQVVFGAAEPPQILLRKVDAATLEIDANITQDVGQLEGDSEVDGIVAGTRIAAAGKSRCRPDRQPRPHGGSTRADRRWFRSDGGPDPSPRRRSDLRRAGAAA